MNEQTNTCAQYCSLSWNSKDVFHHKMTTSLLTLSTLNGDRISAYIARDHQGVKVNHGNLRSVVL